VEKGERNPDFVPSGTSERCLILAISTGTEAWESGKFLESRISLECLLYCERSLEADKRAGNSGDEGRRERGVVGWLYLLVHPSLAYLVMSLLTQPRK
jgi:hypothetical protein